MNDELRKRGTRALELRRVCAGYGETVVLEDIDLALAIADDLRKWAPIVKATGFQLE